MEKFKFPWKPEVGYFVLGLGVQVILAQQFQQDILGDLSKGWANFIESGQVWALIIGVVIGYIIRAFTSY